MATAVRVIGNGRQTPRTDRKRGGPGTYGSTMWDAPIGPRTVALATSREQRRIRAQQRRRRSA